MFFSILFMVADINPSLYYRRTEVVHSKNMFPQPKQPLKLYRFKKGVRMVGIEQLIRPHEGDEILGVRKIDDIMCPAGNHVDGFDLVARNLKADLLVRMDIAFLDQRTTADDDEELPLRVMPMLTLGDAGLADIDTELPVIGCFQKLSEGAAIVAVHL